MKNFLGYLLLLIVSYLFCVVITLGLFRCFSVPESEAVGVATLAWAYVCIFITFSR